MIKKPAPVPTPLAQEQNPQSPPSQQFKATPRFTFSSTPKPTPTQNLPASTPSATRFTTPAGQHEEIIENIESSDPVHDSIETDNHDLELDDLSGDDKYKIDDRSPKRRRLSTSSELRNAHDEQKPEENECPDSLPDSSLPILSSPPAARRPLSSAAARFLPAPSSTLQLPQTAQAFVKPPRFRPPDPSEQAHIDPLPEQFSPHRRGQKYLAGGLAAEVRDWLVNLEAAIPATAQKRDDPWVVRVEVDEVSGGGRAGIAMVKGRQMHSDGIVDNLRIVKVILAGEGAGSGLQRGSMVEAGKTVGIKGPVWEIVLEGEKWGVGVDWKILS